MESFWILNNDDEVMEITLQEPKLTTIFGRDKKSNLSFCIKRQEVQGLMHPVEEAMYVKYGMQPPLFEIKTMPAFYF